MEVMFRPSKLEIVVLRTRTLVASRKPEEDGSSMSRKMRNTSTKEEDGLILEECALREVYSMT
jgi:hypothetical protein